MPFIYFIQASDENGPIKIGYSDSPKARLSTMQTAHAEPLTLLGVITCSHKNEERDLHRRFKSDHIRGEWYRPSIKLRAVVDAAGHVDLPEEEEIDASSDSVREAVQLFFELTPMERSEFMQHVRERFIETPLGLYSRVDFENVIRDAENLNAAAVKLGVCRRTLQYHMRLLGLPPGGKRVLASST